VGLGLIDDGLPTRDHPEIEAYLATAREAAIGQRVVGIEWREIKHEGKPATSAFQVVLESGQSLVLFSPAAYALGHPITGGRG
jgi:hypothetical protein